MVGYRRFEGVAATEALANLYRPMRLFVNFFQPSFRLAEKVRDRALIRKRYHAPLTPHQRLVADPRTPQALKDALDAQHVTLDPVNLLRDIRLAQRALIEIADTVPIATTGVPPLEAFLESLKVAWRSTDEIRPTAQPKPSKPRYRTVPDPLEAVTDTLKAWFEAEPSVTGRQLLDRLQVAHPDAYPDHLVRTVQRRLKIWRRESARALVLWCMDTSASGELSGEALRWLTAPHPAGKLPVPTDAPVETVAATALEPQDPGNLPNGDNQRFGNIPS